jgi:hypothetical protein
LEEFRLIYLSTDHTDPWLLVVSTCIYTRIVFLLTVRSFLSYVVTTVMILFITNFRSIYLYSLSHHPD